MRFRIIAVGKVRQSGLRSELDDYLGRIRRYGACEEIELRDGTESEVRERFARALPSRARTVALEVEGAAMTSRQLASYIERASEAAVPEIVWLIGGAYGLPRAVSDAADLQLSLSAMTLPHRLARLFLAEQLYRAYTIQRGEPYSH